MFEDFGKMVFDFCTTAPEFGDLLFEQHSKKIKSKAFFIDAGSSEIPSYIDGSVTTNLVFRIELKDDFSKEGTRFESRDILNGFILWVRENYRREMSSANNFIVLSQPNKSEVRNNNEAIWSTVLQITFGE